MEFRARKKIDVHRIQCILEVKVKEKRPDLAWYLHKLHRWGLSQGETRNIESYLEYLGLLSQGSKTKEGKKVAETKYAMIPEAGIYEIYYTKDVTFGNRVIDIRRVESRDILAGNTQDFKDYKLFDRDIHFSLNNKNKQFDEFWIEFQKQRDSLPKVIRCGIMDSELEITSDNETEKLIFKSASKGHIKFQEEISGFNLDKNLSIWLSGWNKSLSVQEVKFKDIKDNRAVLNNFKQQINLQGQKLISPNGEDDGSWDVELVVSLVPKTNSDAAKWMEALTFNKLDSKHMYLSTSRLQEIIDEILSDTPILRKHPSFRLNAGDVIKKLKKSEDQNQYYMILAADDLLPNQEAI